MDSSDWENVKFVGLTFRLTYNPYIVNLTALVRVRQNRQQSLFFFTFGKIKLKNDGRFDWWYFERDTTFFKILKTSQGVANELVHAMTIILEKLPEQVDVSIVSYQDKHSNPVTLEYLQAHFAALQSVKVVNYQDFKQQESRLYRHQQEVVDMVIVDESHSLKTLHDKTEKEDDSSFTFAERVTGIINEGSDK